MKLKIKSQSICTRDKDAITIKDEILEQATNDSRWQPGIGLLNHKKIHCFRRKTLGGYEYKTDTDQPFTPEAFNATEYMEWRDS